MFFLVFTLISCDKDKNANENKKLKVVATTTMITDLVKQIAGDKVELNGLMKSGVDPHLYKATEGDINLFLEADVIFYNGLHLEGKLVELFEKMNKRGGNLFAISDGIDKSFLITSSNFANNYDPHIWFDIGLWKKAAEFVANKLAIIDTTNKEFYLESLKTYIIKLDSAENIVKQKVNELPKEQRILITAHDAFNYFGRAYDFKVMGLQGISTLSEASVFDVQNLANFIIENDVKAIFIETSVPMKNIEALRQAVKSKGKEIKIGGELFSDSLGNNDKPEGTYIGMMIYNVNRIVNSLK
ncbi:MAG: zinc ABC transporter substrate-binding protein [Candidatus Kapabacteria bacterium]|nr:zinc ABC transporter substrate-binding protein [Candidatus Kapabacteria bacterium]